MKSILVLAFIALLAVGIYADKCIEQAECDEGTCCAGVPPFGGICMPLTPEGGKCHIVDKTVPIFGDFYIGSCPCEEGLVCVQQGKKKNDGICQVATTTAAPVEVTTLAIEVEEEDSSVDSKSEEANVTE